MPQSNIVFMGTTEFSLKILQAIIANGFNVVAVYTRAPKPAGRNYKLQKTVVHEFAEAHNIPVYTPKTLRTEEAFQEFQALTPTVAVVVAYGLIVPQNILDTPQFGCINIHASLLPRWRGASPIQSAILAGDKKTGVTIMKMDAGIDTGDIVSMREVEISDSMNSEQLSEQLSCLGADMIIQTLSDLPTALQSAHKQPEEGAIYAGKITKEFCQINFSDTAENVQHKIMALSPAPAAWFEIDGIRAKVTDAQVVNSAGSPHGTIFTTANGGMCVECGEGAVLIKTLQPAGKKSMNGSDFLRGHQSLVGKVITPNL